MNPVRNKMPKASVKSTIWISNGMKKNRRQIMGEQKTSYKE